VANDPEELFYLVPKELAPKWFETARTVAINETRLEFGAR